MVKICYLLLCHKNPALIVEQIRYLLDSGGRVVVHIDKNTPREQSNQIIKAYENDQHVEFIKSIPAGWGDWKLVQATLNMIDVALDKFSDCSHFYYLSGDCVPIQPAKHLHSYLKKNNVDIIETSEFYKGGWIKTGPHVERVEHFHFVNERKQKKLFYVLHRLQRYLGIKRKIPKGIDLHIGSQWWCLRVSTVERIMLLLSARREIIRFFKYTWIPDEIFFQSLVASLVAKARRESRPPTFLRFSDYGIPNVFYNDHFEFLTTRNYFFARKLSPNAGELRSRLIKRFLSDENVEHSLDGSGTKPMNLVVNLGRQGFQYGPLAWERSKHLPKKHSLILLVSKKWHVAHQIGEAYERIFGAPYLGFIFNEDAKYLSNFGNFEHDAYKRCRAPAELLFQIFMKSNNKQLVLGIDPAHYEIVKKIQQSINDTRAILIKSNFDENFLYGHASRTGVIGGEKSSQYQNKLLHMVKQEIIREYENIENMTQNHTIISSNQNLSTNINKFDQMTGKGKILITSLFRTIDLE